jgi:hypothetical protein
MKMLTLLFFVTLCGLSGCSTLPESDSAALQGNWKGREIGGRVEGPCYLFVSGNTIEFRGADTNEWYKATFTLHGSADAHQVIAKVTDCPFPQYIGKTSNAIYQIKDGTLRFAGNEPGNPAMPSGFDAPEARRFFLTKN